MKNLRVKLLFIALLLSGVSLTVQAAAYTVNSAADTNDGTCDAAHCTLREAINAINTDGSGSISFAIGSGPATITLFNDLPTITAEVQLDATTQPGYAGSPLIRLRGNANSALSIAAGNTTVRGFDIAGMYEAIGVRPAVAVSNIAIERNFIGVDPFATGDHGIIVAPAGGSITNLTVGNASPSGRNVIGTAIGISVLGNVSGVIAGNFFGILDDGSTTTPSNSILVSVNAGVDIRTSGGSGMVVGGTTPASRNVFGGGWGPGIRVRGNLSPVLIEGNYIGLNAAGSAPLPNEIGVILESATNVTIARNVIVNKSGGLGIYVDANPTPVPSHDNIIRGNFIGTDATGNTIHSAGRAIFVDGSNNLTIGGTTAADRNVIVGGVTEQIRLVNATSNTIITGNYIGVAANGTTVGPSSIAVSVNASGSGNTIGGSAAGAGNVIAGSTTAAIRLGTVSPVTVQGNLIGTNPAGTAALSTSGHGIEVTTGSHLIGGAASGEGNTISGILITGAGTGNGISVAAGSATILGNRIGTDMTGNASIGNAGAGVRVSGTGTTSATIGGTAAGAGNLISANPIGISVSTDAAATILGNRIGTNAAGMAALANDIGIRTQLNVGSTKVIEIGGSAAGAGNLISGNTTSGISITNGGAITILGNRIGTNGTGMVAIPSSGSGIACDSGVVTIGGTTPGAGNLISGANVGMDVRGCTATVLGNFIGTNATGTAPIAGHVDVVGIQIGGQSTVGGVAAGAGNIIAYHSLDGIAQSLGSGTSYLGNSIHDNGGLAIDLNADGVTANDAGDADAGINNLQNFPVLLSAVTSAGATAVSGTLNSIANTVFVIEIFSNTTTDPSGFGEAETLLGRTTVTTDASGNAAFNLSLPPVAAGNAISATATNQTTNDTSELSADVTVSAPGTFQFSAATTSVGEAAGTVTLTVTRSGGTLPATVDYTTTNGTALAGSDYTATGGTLSFAAADTSMTIVIPITSDTIDEVDETFSVALSNAGGATIGAPSTEVVTITDDDAAPVVSAGNASVIEGNSGTTTLTFNIVLSAASEQTVTVDYTTVDGTASSGSDYGMRFGTLTFAPGDTLKTVAVTINGDVTAEADETLQLVLSNASNAIIAGAPATGTITNDDGPPAISISDLTVIEGNSGNTTASVVVWLSNPSSSSVTVDYATNANTATSSSDFTAASGTLTFDPGVTSMIIEITIAGDTVVEGNEGFFVNLTNAANGSIADAQAVVTIADDDGSPSLTISDVAVNEAAGNATITVLLAPASAQSVTVQYTTADATATAGSDYTTTSGMLTFDAGETAQTITVLIANDAVTEASETFTATLSSPSNASIANGNATVTIIDDDATPTLTIGDVSAIEGSAAAFTVALSNPSASIVTVAYATTSGTAGAGDYTAASGTLTYQPGETSKPVVILTTVDAVREPDETYFVDLSAATNATIVRPRATGAIVDDDGTPTVVVSDATVTEGNGGTASAVFTVTLAGDTSQSVTVDYAAANGTASAGSDYAATSGQLTFAAGVATRTITVPVVGDLEVEADETFFVNLSSSTNATIADGQALGTITNDDTAAVVPSIAIDDVNVVEGATGTTSATFTVTLSAATTNSVTVGYATASGTASAGSDYAASSGTLVFAPGVTTQTIAVAIAGDTAVEPNEGFVVNLSSPTNATIADGQGAGSILNDDSAAIIPAIVIADASVTEGNGGTTNATFTVTLSAPTTNTVTVEYATANGTATAGSDYAANSGTLFFAPGATSQTITIAVAGDTLVEPDETFFVNLSNATSATISDGQGSGTILNDDSAAVVPSIAIGDASVIEGNGGTTNATFVVMISEATTNTVTVDYATANGTATAGSDYAASNGTVVFAAGATSQTITIAVAGDALVEPDETFFVNLINPTNAAIIDAQGLGTITNDDSSAVMPSIAISNATVAEGNAGTTNETFVVTLSAPAANTVTVDYATANGTASAGSDYAASSGTLVFAPGATSQTITISVIGDTLVEAQETFFVNLSAATNASIADGQGLGTITNDDSSSTVPSIGIDDVTMAEGTSGATTATFTVTLSAASASTVSVTYATADGSAMAGGDYAAGGGTLVFAPGATSQTIGVAIVGDTIVENDESFFVTLSDASNATLSREQGVGTIVNDDFLALTPSISIAGTSVTEGDRGVTTASFVVTLSHATTLPVSVDFETAGGTASAGVDYERVNGTLLFSPGEVRRTIDVPVIGDETPESDETFSVRLSGAVNATLVPVDVHADGTIRDDDGARVRAVVVVAGSGPGVGGAFFRTQLVLHDPTDDAISGNLVIHPMGGGATRTFGYALRARETREIGSAMDLAGLGSIDIVPLTGGMPEVSVHVYNDAGERGTTGFNVALVSTSDAIGEGQRGVLLTPVSASAFRYNVGVRALESGADATFILRRSNGDVAARVSRSFAPHELAQFSASSFLGTSLQGADSIEIVVSRGSAIVYGSAIDNITQDPSFLVANPLP